MGNKTKSVFQGIDTVIVRVSDIETSKDWYLNKLGLPVIWEDLTLKLVVFETHGPTSITLWQTDKKFEHKEETASYPIFRTPNAKEAKLVLEEKGVKVGELHEDEVVRYFFFYDPDRNILEACETHG